MYDMKNRKGSQRAIDGLLRETFRRQDTDYDFVERVLTEVKSNSGSKKRFKRACLAAVLIFGIILGWMIPTGFDGDPEVAAIASLRMLDGTVTLVRNGEVHTANPGELIYPGDKLSSTGQVIVDYLDSSVVELSDGGCSFLKTESDGKLLYIESGKVFCSITTQEEEQPMMFTTPHGGGRGC